MRILLFRVFSPAFDFLKLYTGLNDWILSGCCKGSAELARGVNQNESLGLMWVKSSTLFYERVQSQKRD